MLYLYLNISSQFIHLPKQGLNERGFTSPHMTNHTHQLTPLHVDIYTGWREREREREGEREIEREREREKERERARERERRGGGEIEREREQAQTHINV